MSDMSRVEQVFYAALEKKSPAERLAFLDEACQGSPELRQAVERLLAAHDAAGSFLDRPPSEVLPTVDQPSAPVDPSQREGADLIGASIGPYKLLEVIGDGGMGVVYMADQHEPIRRRVALKVIKPGLDTRQVVARFEAERQALALMDHPNIARVFDAGTTAAGRPYFVMELVRGVPITDYCDRNKLPVPARLELFIQVCQAVQHAHQKGIIHRDIKPTNVLVTLHDGRPVPKVIDFGVAKAINQQLTEKTLFTNFAQMVGTPLYMSPEQAEMSGLDIDTRTDIYSLGVLLYELLTGTTPFDRETLRKAGYDEMRRIIREQEPVRPSTRISSADNARTVVAANRQVDPVRLGQIVRGDLDWIVMKSLEKDRQRRYESASGLAADVTRYLTFQPVEAGPPSAVYRFRKFARRNRAMIAAAGAILGALILGTVISSWQSFRAMRAELLAEEQAAFARANATEAVANAEAALKEKDRADGKAREADVLRKVALDRRRKADQATADAELKLSNVRLAAVKYAAEARRGTVIGTASPSRPSNTTIRAALAGRDVDAAFEELMKAAIDPEAVTAHDLERSIALCHYLDRFWIAVRMSTLTLQAGDELMVDGQAVLVIEIGPDGDRFVLRSRGQNRVYRTRQLPTNLAVALAERWLSKQESNSQALVGAFLCVDSKGDASRGRQFLAEAKAAGSEAAVDVLRALGP